MIRKLQAFPSVRGVAFAVGVFVATVLVLVGEKSALAQATATQFGNQGQLAVTAENLFGFSMERIGTTLANNNESSQTYSNFGLLHRSTNFRGPWVGAHYFVIPNLSIGATVGILTTGGSTTTTSQGTTVTRDMDSGFQLVAIPKVGYALMLTNVLGFWFRGGPGLITSTSSDADSDASSNRTYWFLSLDALFVVTPVQNFGFYVGPQGNFSFAGSTSSTNTMGVTVSQDSNFRSFSIDAGLLGYFDL